MSKRMQQPQKKKKKTFEELWENRTNDKDKATIVIKTWSPWNLKRNKIIRPQQQKFSVKKDKETNLKDSQPKKAWQTAIL